MMDEKTLQTLEDMARDSSRMECCGPRVAEEDVLALIAEVRLLRSLLNEAETSGYLKTRITCNETELEDRVYAALHPEQATDDYVPQPGDASLNFKYEGGVHSLPARPGWVLTSGPNGSRYEIYDYPEGAEPNPDSTKL